MITRASLSALIAELSGDLRDFERIADQNGRAWERVRKGSVDPIDWGALGFTLHHLYGILESYFLRISKEFENTLPGDRWHRTLVEKMRLDIAGMRPALLNSEEDFQDVLELMRFRHRFRNLYGEDLDPVKTAIVQERASRLIERFPRVHEAFVEKIQAISGGLP